MTWYDIKDPRRKVTASRTQVRTWDVFVTLECGHTSVYTMSGNAMRKPKPLKQSMGCWTCGEALRKEARG